MVVRNVWEAGVWSRTQARLGLERPAAGLYPPPPPPLSSPCPIPGPLSCAVPVIPTTGLEARVTWLQRHM